MGEARNIYNTACAQIAADLAQEGFEYRPSKHTLVRNDGDLTREITFQSSFRNFTLPEQGTGVLHKTISPLPLVGEIAAFGSVTLNRPHWNSFQDLQAVACLAEKPVGVRRPHHRRADRKPTGQA